MAVRILVKRTIPEGREEKLMPLIIKLRVLASQQPGYISGETLKMIDDPNCFLVISTWNAVEDWDRWFNSDTRSEIQKMIDEVCDFPTTYEKYHYPVNQRVMVSETAAP